MTNPTRFEVRIWEKAEHWYFDVTVVCPRDCEETDLSKWLRREYPPRSYSIRDIRPIN